LKRAASTANAVSKKMLVDIKSGKEPLNLDELCGQILSPEQMLALSLKVPCLRSIGATSASVAEMGQARQKQLVTLGNALISGLAERLKAGEGDTNGVLDLLASKADCLNPSQSGATAPGKFEHPVCAVLAESIATASRLGQRGTAKQLLSVAVAAMNDLGAKYQDVRAYFTRFVQLKPGQRVRVMRGGFRKTARAVVVGEDGDDAFLVHILEEPTERVTMDGVDEDEEEPDKIDENEEMDVEMEMLMDEELTRTRMDGDEEAGQLTESVPRSRIIAVFDMRIDHHQIANAVKHSSGEYPGAQVRTRNQLNYGPQIMARIQYSIERFTSVAPLSERSPTMFTVFTATNS